MNNRLIIRKTHRWLGVIAAVQLLIWTSSGLYFALIPIEDIRGEHLLHKAAAFRLGHIRMIPPSSLVRGHPELSNLNADQVQIIQRLNKITYGMMVDGTWLIYDAETSERLDPLTEQQAITVASNRTSLPVVSASLVHEVEPGSEYRGGELPAWQIELAGADHASLYVGANSGQVRAVRTSYWRIYDLLWSLHIMDYEDREDFNHWLLRGFALLGVITIFSGIILFISSTKWRAVGGS